jgi:hypothetical protein
MKLYTDLQESRILIGKNQDEVKDLLGEPDWKTDNERVNEYIYSVDLGHKYGSGPWYYFYKVRFDQEKSTAQESFLSPNSETTNSLGFKRDKSS